MSVPAKRLLTSRWTAFASLAAAVVGFAGAWTRGDLLIDGTGMTLYVRLVLDHLVAHGRVGYWMPELWAGTPVWALGPSLPILLLAPLAALFGAAGAVKVGILALQVAGAWGAYTLARALWHDTAAALVAGVVYGLDPLVISHAALIGNEGVVGVIAAAPWLVWSLRRGLRGDGTRYLVAAGLVAAFAILHQAESAYALLPLCALVVVLEARRTRWDGAEITARRFLGRVGLVVGVSFGAIAHWLVPFLVLHKWFVLSPRALVQGELLSGLANTVATEPGLFLHRSGGLHGVVTPVRQNLIAQVQYLGWVPVGVTIVTALLLARRDDERTLSAVLLASAVAVWMSTGAVSLAEGGPVMRGQVMSMALTGLVAGALLGGFVRRLSLRRAKAPVLVAAAAFLFAVPYLRPFVLAQRVVPFLSSIRFPRFYVIAVLGLALGTAWPVSLVHRWLRLHRPRLAGVGSAALAVAVTILVVVDAWPYRSFYRLRAPARAAAYRQAAATLASRPPGSRVDPATFDASPVSSLQGTGAYLTLGWPHAVASAQVWRLTFEAALSPGGYAARALGLSATSYVASEQIDRPTTALAAVTALRLTPNPASLPVVRAYDQSVVVGDRSIAPELAVALAHHNVGVVTGGHQAARSSAATVVGEVLEKSACGQPSMTKPSAGLAGEVSTACAMHRWLSSVLFGADLVDTDRMPGARFRATADSLRGLSVWFHDPPGQSQLVIHELAPDGTTAGREVARVDSSGTDDNGMSFFGFDPVTDSAGKSYVFDVECPDCFSELAPQIVVERGAGRRGNLLLKGRLDPTRTAAFAPVYDRPAPAAPSSTKLDARRLAPGQWQVKTSGARPALVVVAEAYFPGWQARVDGRPAPVLEADGAFLGVAIGPGVHNVTLDYHPPAAVGLGRLITAATLAVLTILGLRSLAGRRRRALRVTSSRIDTRNRLRL
ncbi:MAG: hypothetical protein DLM65_13185 [Candidatus Aeolococcus gillhamiae]|uniref:Membrane protein 6-pyruvoyl-tetrahydropterin synthase-related domain-containing protein n=1 Tax=Candidatus Aeolococcus gillhamiae TaxID=3127015 RepID=A0A2W5YZC0_9BACT|nr:MAG: hypothetical protein DLM65_13185 [Candidatus Dormibacter sp. RRmetagenome_bin12]